MIRHILFDKDCVRKHQTNISHISKLCKQQADTLDTLLSATGNVTHLLPSALSKLTYTELCDLTIDMFEGLVSCRSLLTKTLPISLHVVEQDYYRLYGEVTNEIIVNYNRNIKQAGIRRMSNKNIVRQENLNLTRITRPKLPAHTGERPALSVHTGERPPLPPLAERREPRYQLLGIREESPELPQDTQRKGEHHIREELAQPHHIREELAEPHHIREELAHQRGCRPSAPVLDGRTYLNMSTVITRQGYIY